MDKEPLIILIWLGICAAIVLPCVIWVLVARLQEKKELAKETPGDKQLRQLYFEIFQEKQEIKELYHLILTHHTLSKEVPELLDNTYLTTLHRYNNRIEKYHETLKEQRYSTISWEKVNFDTVEEIENYVIKNFFK